MFTIATLFCFLSPAYHYRLLIFWKFYSQPQIDTVESVLFFPPFSKRAYFLSSWVYYAFTLFMRHIFFHEFCWLVFQESSPTAWYPTKCGVAGLVPCLILGIPSHPAPWKTSCSDSLILLPKGVEKGSQDHARTADSFWDDIAVELGANLLLLGFNSSWSTVQVQWLWSLAVPIKSESLGKGPRYH